MIAVAVGLGPGLALGQAKARPPVHAPVARYRTVDLGTLGGLNSYGEAVNDKGQVVGVSQTKTGQELAFLWEKGRMRSLGTLGGTTSAAYDINSGGQIVGTSTTRANKLHAFLWSGGHLRDLGFWAFTAHLNDRTQIVGTAYDGKHTYAYLWDRGHLVRLDKYGLTLDSQAYAINNKGVVVGSDTKGAFVYAAGRITRPTATAGTATLSGLAAVNSRGDFAGALTVNNSVHAALLRGGRLFDLGVLEPADASNGGDGGSRAVALNESDQVVGTSVTATNPDGHGFVWSARTGILDLGVVYEHGPGDVSRAMDINNNGVIVGSSVVRAHISMDDDGMHAVLWIPVPK